MPLRLLWQPRVQTLTDAATVYLTLTPSSVEIFDASDAAEVYLDIQPGYIYIQVDYLLQIMGLEKRWELGKTEQRWTLFEAVKRWTLMFTRRTLWRF